MKKLIIYEDKNGYLRIIKPAPDFQHPTESDYAAMGRLAFMAFPDVCSFLAIHPQKIPQDTTFRSAWKMGPLENPVVVDIDRAIAIHRTRLQMAAKGKTYALQSELQDAVAKQNLPLQTAIRRTIAILETIHEMDLTHCKTPEDVKYAIPKELHEHWDFYDPGAGVPGSLHQPNV